MLIHYSTHHFPMIHHMPKLVVFVPFRSYQPLKSFVVLLHSIMSYISLDIVFEKVEVLNGLKLTISFK